MELDIHWHIHLKTYYRDFTLNALWLYHYKYLFVTINTSDIHENEYRET